MTSLTTHQRKSPRTCRRPDRFIPDASAWTPGSANGILNPTKIDHWQLSFNGHVSESQNEKKVIVIMKMQLTSLSKMIKSLKRSCLCCI